METLNYGGLVTATICFGIYSIYIQYIYTVYIYSYIYIYIYIYIYLAYYDTQV